MSIENNLKLNLSSSNKLTQPERPGKLRQPLLSLPGIPWAVTILLFSVTTLGCLVGAGRLMQFMFPLGSSLVGIYLYFFHPIFYINFNWWIWCFTPLLRRLGDYHQGSFQDGNLMLVAPYLVTLISIITVLKQFPKIYRTGDFPFIMALFGIAFGSFIGIINNPTASVARTFLDWMPPVLFGFHLSTSWRLYPRIKVTTQKTFIWIVLLTGAYGIYQYLVAPAWDTYWLIGVDNVSFGLPEALKIRVWSTMNSPPPFGCIMMGGLLLLFTSKGFMRIPAAGVGYLALLLSLVRAAWLGWIIGLLTLIISLKSNLQMRLVATVLVMGVCVVPLTIMEPFSTVIGDRLDSFTNIQTDSSYTARAETYDRNLEIALSSFLGQGLGSTWVVRPNGEVERIALDSGILDTFFTLGWFGGLPYLSSIILLLLNQFRGHEGRFDGFASASRSITLSFFSILMLGPFMVGLAGLMFWGFLGIGMAARKFYIYENKLLLKEATNNA